MRGELDMGRSAVESVVFVPTYPEEDVNPAAMVLVITPENAPVVAPASAPRIVTAEGMYAVLVTAVAGAVVIGGLARLA